MPETFFATRGGFVAVCAAVVLITLLFTLIFWRCEGDGGWDALYNVTLSVLLIGPTNAPKSSVGRIIVILSALVGFATLTYLFASAARWFTRSLQIREGMESYRRASREVEAAEAADRRTPRIRQNE